MRERTIGGKPIEEIFELLMADIPGALKATEERGQPYLEVEALRRYFDSIVPVQNYDFEISELQYVADKNAASFVCVGKLTLYDDNGEKITSKSYVGANDCPKRKDGSGFVEFAMAARNAAVNARKSCIEMYGCGRNQLAAAKKEIKGKKEAYRNTEANAHDSRSEISSGSTAMGTSTRGCSNQGANMQSGSGRRWEHPPYGAGSYRLICQDVGKIKNLPRMFLIPVKMMEHGNYETQLLIWKNSVKDPEEIVSRICPGKAFVCTGKYEPFNNSHRIVLTRFGESA